MSRPFNIGDRVEDGLYKGKVLRYLPATGLVAVLWDDGDVTSEETGELYPAIIRKVTDEDWR